MLTKLFLHTILFYSTINIAIRAEWIEDGYNYKYTVNEFSDILPTHEEDDNIIQFAPKSICYDEVGCFEKDGTFKHIKQLPEPPELINTRFLLYTKKNRDNPQELDYRNPQTVVNSNINKTLPLMIIVHGFGGKMNNSWIVEMIDAVLEKLEVNLIFVDWGKGARFPNYFQASVNTELIGRQIAAVYFLIKDNFGIKEQNLHLIGFSLGAHVMGFAGKRMKELRKTRPGRITGLDPASPLFEEKGSDVHLYKGDADFVDIIHTNADLKMYGKMGIETPIGDVDFYPNGGRRQTGCPSTHSGLVKDAISLWDNEKHRNCNHERAVRLFTDSILNSKSCQYIGYKCEDYAHFSAGNCVSCKNGCGLMGYNVKGNGTYYLLTKGEKPYCGHLMKLSIHFSENTKKSFGSIVLTITGADSVKENITLTEKDDKLIPGGSRSAAVAIRSLPLKSVEVLYMKYDGYIKKGKDKFALERVLLKSAEGDYVFKTCEEITLKTDVFKAIQNC